MVTRPLCCRTPEILRKCFAFGSAYDEPPPPIPRSVGPWLSGARSASTTGAARTARASRGSRAANPIFRRGVVATSAPADETAASPAGATIVVAATGTPAATGNQDLIAQRLAAFAQIGCSASLSRAVLAGNTLASAVNGGHFPTQTRWLGVMTVRLTAP